jgi:hypothetical protein
MASRRSVNLSGVFSLAVMGILYTAFKSNLGRMGTVIFLFKNARRVCVSLGSSKTTPGKPSFNQHRKTFVKHKYIL